MIEPSPLVEAFRARHGRAPRVLHIGNIANNAFLNAKILNQHGYDCDVMCADYYHIMGCPEWEEADFIGGIGDQFHPDWTAVDLQGYSRPRWFAQGPQHWCIDYLIARRSGNAAAAQLRWEELGLANRTFARPVSGAAQAPHAQARWRTRVASTKRYYRMLRERPDVPHLVLARAKRMLGIQGRWPRWLSAPTLPLFRVIARMFAKRPQQWQLAPWFEMFAAEFPDRPDGFEANDLIAHLAAVPQWRALFAYYDLVVAYATDGISPLLAGQKYFALEHGTLREIPYRTSAEGRRTALAYRKAEHVFVTNFDCLDSARRLAPARFTLINHPFDEDAGLQVTGWEAERARLQQELDCDVLFFFPTRHDWVPGTGYADKANDVFLRAFAALRGQRRQRVGMVCCGWGANIAQSQALLAEHGCAAHVKWINPLPTVQFERMCRACHCVVDQFKLGAFGGVMFKAMAVGAPMLTYLDEEQLHRQYPEIPPVINCRTTDDIIAAVVPLLQNRPELEHYGSAARAWMRRHHGKAQTVRLQEAQFRHVLFPEAGAARGRLASP